MSTQTADTKNASDNNSLPKFMNENHKPSDTDIEEKSSWLNNNLHRLMIGVSALWFAIVLIYITQFFGWSNLFLMMPDEFGGFLAGITLPLAIIWVVMAYIDRGTSFKQEAKFLRAYMNQLVYPEDGAPQTAKAMADAIRSQVVELQQVTKLATGQTAIIKDEIGSNINELARLVSTLDAYSSKTLVELSEGVKFLVKNFETISEKAEASTAKIAAYNRDFSTGANDIESNVDALFEKLLPRIKEIKSSAQILKDISDSSNHNILRANELLNQFNNEATSNLNNVAESLNKQTGLLQKVSQSAVDNCNLIKKEVVSQIDGLGNILNKHTESIQEVIAKSSDEMHRKINEITTHAGEGCSQIHAQISKELSVLDGSVDEQLKKVDSAMARHNHGILSLVNTLEEKSSAVNQKFTQHGDSIAQEIDKLMVRSNTLEESIAIQVDNLNNVSGNIIGSMEKIDLKMGENLENLHQKSAAAEEELAIYLSDLEKQTNRLEDMAGIVMAKSSEVSEEIVTRHNNLNETVNAITDKISALNKLLNDSALNVNLQSKNALNEMNEVADNMNKHAVSLTEASSIVVAQSQISEASLAQQQRNITNSANRVEEIKADLKRQIEDLAQASGTLENDAATAVNLLKAQLTEMLNSCQSVIVKSQAINDNLSEQSTQFDTNANRTLAKVTQIENVLQIQSANMENLSQAISGRAQTVEEILTRQTSAVENATAANTLAMENITASFESQSKTMNETARETAGYVAGLTQTLDDKAAALNLLFNKQENEFFDTCDKIAENTGVMSDALKKQINIIEQSADKVFSRMVLLEEDTHKHAEAVVNNSHRSIDKLAEIENLISAKNDAVAALVKEVTDGFKSITSTIENKVHTFDSTVKNIKEQTSEAAKTILGNCSKLQNIHVELAGEANNVAKLLEEQAKNIDMTLVKTKMQAEDIRETLSAQRDNLTDVANTLATQTRLGEASLAQQYKYLSDATTDVALKMKEINDTFKSNTDNVFDISTKIAYEFDVLGDRLIKAGEDVAKSSRNSLKNIEQVNMALSQSSEDLDATIQHSAQNIGGVFKDYEKYIAGFNTVTAETSTGVIEINNLITEQSDKMVKISEDTKKLVDCFNTVLNETSSALSNRANQAYDKVKGLGENLKNLGLQLEEATKLSATHFENSGDKLRATISEIATNAERISNEIRSSGEVFIKQSGVLVAATEDTVNKVHVVMGELLDTSKEFSTKGDNIVKQSLRFNDVISTQIKLLNEHTLKADSTLKNLDASLQGIKIDSFLKDAAVIVEKLQTASVDINRIFNPKDEEDLWKKYYNGDTSVFVRYLARNMTKQQIAAIRKEFEKSAEFRNLVSSYLSEFEVLISRAKTHEHSGILLSVISGADIGKLYYILAKTLDKLN